MSEMRGVVEWIRSNLVKDYRVVPARAGQYYHLDRNFNFDPNYTIPIGVTASVRYSGHEPGGTNDRDLIQYLLMFNEIDLEDSEFRRQVSQVPGGNPSQYFPPELIKYPFKKRPDVEVLFGGYDSAFATGKTVLELGSGRAIGLMQLAERHPDVSFVGVDILYDKKNPIYPGKQGLQLTKDDWEDLKQIPDGSIDTIISYQALGMWGLPVISDDETPEKVQAKTNRLKKIGSTLTRVVKTNGTVWMDGDMEKLKQLEAHLDPKVWECHIRDTGFNFVARKLI